MKYQFVYFVAPWLLGAVIPTEAVAQHLNSPRSPCQSAASNAAMGACFDREAKSADAALNATYVKVMGVLDEPAKASLRTAQRAWITYRDAACNAEAAPYQGGSAYGVARVACIAAATKERVTFLRDGLWWKVDQGG